MSRPLCLAAILLISGCASFSADHSRTLLMDRSSGKMQECTVDKWRSRKSFGNYMKCISAYEQQGYEIWSQY